MREIVGIGLTSIALVAACSSSSGTNNDATTSTSATSTSSGGTSAPVGSACAKDGDCDMGLSCEATDPGGQCVKSCTAETDCPAGSTCTDEKTCYKACTTAADCPRAGYACVDSMTVGMTATKTCDVAPTPAVGDACTKDADCGMGLSCETTDPGGQCVKSCMAQSDCPDGSTCTDEKTCYKTCAMASDCPRMGYACVDAMTVTMTPVKTCDTP